METHETQGDYWGHMNHRDRWVIKRLRETTGDLGDSQILLGNHKTQTVYCGLIRLR